MKKIAPLPGSFMLAAMLGFAISLVWVYPQSAGFGVSFMIVFGAMFIASIISLTYAPADALLEMEGIKK